jgi:hypothetical protein
MTTDMSDIPDLSIVAPGMITKDLFLAKDPIPYRGPDPS